MSGVYRPKAKGVVRKHCTLISKVAFHGRWGALILIPLCMCPGIEQLSKWWGMVAARFLTIEWDITQKEGEEDRMIYAVMGYIWR